MKLTPNQSAIFMAAQANLVRANTQIIKANDKPYIIKQSKLNNDV